MCLVYAAMRPVRSVFPLSAQVAGSPVRLPIFAAASRRSGELVSVWVGLTHTHTHAKMAASVDDAAAVVVSSFIIDICVCVGVLLCECVLSLSQLALACSRESTLYICYKQI